MEIIKDNPKMIKQELNLKKGSEDPINANTNIYTQYPSPLNCIWIWEKEEYIGGIITLPEGNPLPEEYERRDDIRSSECMKRIDIDIKRGERIIALSLEIEEGRVRRAGVWTSYGREVQVGKQIFGDAKTIVAFGKEGYYVQQIYTGNPLNYISVHLMPIPLPCISPFPNLLLHNQLNIKEKSGGYLREPPLKAKNDMKNFRLSEYLNAGASVRIRHIGVLHCEMGIIGLKLIYDIVDPQDGTLLYSYITQHNYPPNKEGIREWNISIKEGEHLEGISGRYLNKCECEKMCKCEDKRRCECGKCNHVKECITSISFLFNTGRLESIENYLGNPFVIDIPKDNAIFAISTRADKYIQQITAYFAHHIYTS